MFDIHERAIDTAALTMRYHAAPWDTPTVGGSVAVISEISVREPQQARKDFRVFREWCTTGRVVLVSCRIAHERLRECGFLEMEEFRFIELNYRPELAQLQKRDVGHSDEFMVEAAADSDEPVIASIAGRIFEAGRFHRDPMIDPSTGDLRYRRWVSNAFRNPRQSVLKCLRNSEIQAFFVVESPSVASRFWSLVGLAPGLGGHGIGTSVWRAVLRWHREEGVDVVSTSISSLNVPVLNLYVKLGFRFPAPMITLHWCPRGRIAVPA